MIVFIGILPRMTDSLHPGNGGNPAFGSYDLDNGMRLVFYPAVIGWILMGWWIATLRVRLDRLTAQQTPV
jgi:heme exporter protein C